MQYGLANKLVFSKLRERTGGNIRYFISGGAPLSPEIAKFFYSAGLVILEGYGLTETSPVISANNLQHYRLGSVGRPIAGVEVKIAKDGEILTRGPHVMRGYFNNEQATREAISNDGWFHTGDIVRRGAAGQLHFIDRRKNVIRRSGENISAVEVESVLNQHPAVKACAVAATPDAVRGDEVLACVVTHEPVPDGQRESLAHLAAHRMVDGVDLWLVELDLQDVAVTGDFDEAGHLEPQLNAGITSLQNSSSDRFCSFMPSPRLA
jgi:long-subunit acyl-CoA synthetase (AMP-forming)